MNTQTISDCCRSIDIQIFDISDLIEALDTMGLSKPAERLRLLRDNIYELTTEIIQLTRADLTDQLAHNAGMLSGLLQVGLKMAGDTTDGTPT